MRLSMRNSNKIDRVLYYLEDAPTVLLKIDCPYCQARKSLVIEGDKNKFVCNTCRSQGKIDKLVEKADEVFGARHIKYRSMMQNRSY